MIEIQGWAPTTTAHRLVGVSNGAFDGTGYTLSADGRRTGINRNGSAETYGYDNGKWGQMEMGSGNGVSVQKLTEVPNFSSDPASKVRAQIGHLHVDGK